MRYEVFLKDIWKNYRDKYPAYNLKSRNDVRRYNLSSSYVGDISMKIPFEFIDDEGYILESIFQILNIDKPKDYNLRSLSVGDVVKLENGNAYLVCPVGWKQVYLTM